MIIFNPIRLIIIHFNQSLIYFIMARKKKIKKLKLIINNISIADIEFDKNYCVIHVDYDSKIEITYTNQMYVYD